MDSTLPTRSNFIDITNHSFGRLFVKPYAGEGRWNCRCECGSSKIVLSGNLRKGATKSCGCLNKEVHVTHGMNRTPIYFIYHSMKSRCYNKNDKNYHNYGGRGIAVCDRWLESIENFVYDMGDKPTPSHSIDRIDNDGNYTPYNCKWSTPREQVLNRRMQNNNTSGVRGVSMYKRTGQWKVRIKTNGVDIHLGYFTNKEDAIDARKEAELIYHEEAQ